MVAKPQLRSSLFRIAPAGGNMPTHATQGGAMLLFSTFDLIALA